MSGIQLGGRTLWLLTACVLVGAVRCSWISADPAATRSALAAVSRVTLLDSATLAAAADSATDMDAFRLDRAASDVAFGQTALPATAPPMPLARPAPPRLTAVLGGPPWRAILEGIPGHERGLVVQPGDRVGSFSVLAIARNTLKLKGVDTTWQLTLKE